MEVCRPPSSFSQDVYFCLKLFFMSSDYQVCTPPETVQNDSASTLEIVQSRYWRPRNCVTKTKDHE